MHHSPIALTNLALVLCCLWAFHPAITKDALWLHAPQFLPLFCEMDTLWLHYHFTKLFSHQFFAIWYIWLFIGQQSITPSFFFILQIGSIYEFKLDASHMQKIVTECSILLPLHKKHLLLLYVKPLLDNLIHQ